VGRTFMRIGAVVGSTLTAQTSDVISLNAGDIIELLAVQYSGGTVNTQTAEHVMPRLSFVKVG